MTDLIENANEQKQKTMKITVPEILVPRIEAAMAALKERGSNITMSELMSPLFLDANDRYFEAQIESLTPPHYYLDLARAQPELFRKLVNQARRALHGVSIGEALPMKEKKPRKPRMKRVSNLVESVQTVSD